MEFSHGSTILFQGDSVTDCGRDKSNPASLGSGYVLMITGMLASVKPELDLRIVNRGISGNRTKDLAARWKEDCLDIRPTVLSILVGINNVWRRYDSNDPTEASQFEDEYRVLLRQARDGGVAEIVIMEPFVLPVPDDRRGWRVDLDPKIAICRSLAAEFEAHYVPLDGILAAASTRVRPSYWAADGVHPTAAGHGLIARSWMDLVV